MTDSVVVAILAVVSALVGYTVFVAVCGPVVYAEPLWLLALVLVGFQLVLTLLVFRWIGALPPQMASFPKYRAFLDPAQRAVMLKISVVFFLAPLPHGFHLVGTPVEHAAMVIEESRTRAIRGQVRCDARGPVRSKEGNLELIGGGSIPWLPLGRGHCEDVLADLADKGGKEIPVRVRRGVLTSVEY